MKENRPFFSLGNILICLNTDMGNGLQGPRVKAQIKAKILKEVAASTLEKVIVDGVLY